MDSLEATSLTTNQNPKKSVLAKQIGQVNKAFKTSLIIPSKL